LGKKNTDREVKTHFNSSRRLSSRLILDTIYLSKSIIVVSIHFRFTQP